MMFGVPQFIDIEDKIVGPLTGKQLLWLFIMGAILLIAWMSLTFAAFIAVGVPIVLIFVALAFYRPYNQPLIKFVFSGTYFFFRPKTYTWNRLGNKIKKRVKIKTSKKNVQQKKKTIKREDLKNLANMLDKK